MQICRSINRWGVISPKRALILLATTQFYAERLGNHVCCTFIFTFCIVVFICCIKIYGIKYSYLILILYVAQFAGAVEYIDCISAEGQDSLNECPEDDIKQSDSEAPVMLELWGKWSTPTLPSLTGSLWPGVVAPDSSIWHLKRVLLLNWIAWNRTVWHLTLCKQMTDI